MLRRLAVGLISVPALLLPAVPALAEDTNTTDPAGALAEQIRRVAPQEAQVAPLPTEPDADGFRAPAREGLRFPEVSTGAVTVQRPGTSGVRIGLPSDGTARSGLRAPDGTVAYLNSMPATDVVAQAFADSARLHTVMRSAQAPEEVHYPVALPPGGRLEPGKDGTVQIVDAQGTFLTGVAAPWARDATGKPVPTHYEIRGSDLVQVVQHRPDAAYPVVSDPWLGFDMIDSLWWSQTQGPGKWTLNTQPTTWARLNGGGYFPAAAGWEELQDKAQDTSRGIGNNPGGFRDQYICHQQLPAWLRPGEYHLDEWLPDVSYWETVTASCNPGM